MASTLHAHPSGPAGAHELLTGCWRASQRRERRCSGDWIYLSTSTTSGCRQAGKHDYVRLLFSLQEKFKSNVGGESPWLDIE